MRKKRKDRFDLIELKCIICKMEFKRIRWIEESRIQQNKLGPVCGTRCAGKLGWKTRQSLMRESSKVDV